MEEVIAGRLKVNDANAGHVMSRYASSQTSLKC